MAGLNFDIFAKDKTGQAFDSVKNKVGGLKSAFGSLKSALGGFGGLIAGAFSIAALKNIGDMASKINDLSVRFKVSAESLSQYSLIAGEVGVDNESIARSWQQLAKNSVEAANGNKQLTQTFAQLGIDAAKFKDLPLDQQFAVLAEAMQGIENPAERVNIAMALMGKSGAEMLQVMELGGDGLRKMQEEADRLGVTLTQTQAGAIDGMMDAFGRLGLVLRGVGQDLLATVAPALEVVANVMTEILLYAINIVKAAFESLRQLFNEVVAWMIRRFGDLLNVVAEGKALLANIPGEIGEAYAKEAEALKSQADILRNVTAETDKIAESQKNHNAQLQTTADLLKKVQTNMPTLNKSYEDVGKATKKVATQAQNDFDSLEKQIGRTADTAQTRFVDALLNMGDGFESFRDIADNALKQISSSILNNLINSMFQAQNTLPWLSGGGGGGGFGSFLGSAGNFLGSLFAGGFAEGGTLRPGQWGITGERGMEAVYAGNSPLTVIPFAPAENTGAGTQIINTYKTYQIDARGAEAGVEKRIMAALKQVDQSIESRSVMAVANARQRNPGLV
jgi:methyl-accepting chemotaxis protein